MKRKRTETQIPSTEGGEFWSDRHQQEVEFQRLKARKIKVEAFKRGMLLAEEQDPGLPGELQHQTAKDAENARMRANETTRIDNRINPRLPKLCDMKGWNLFVEGDQVPHALQNLLDSNFINVTEDRMQAHGFVAKDPLNDLSQRSKWYAVINGCYCMSVSWLLEGTGPCIKYKAAVKTQRRIWISAMAKDRHPALYNIIEQVCSTRGSKWKVIAGGKDDFLQMFNQQKARKRAAVVLGVVASKEGKDSHE